MANKHEKVINVTDQRNGKNPRKPTMRCHLSVRMASSRNQQITDAGEDVEKREPSCPVGAAAVENSMQGPH